MLLFYRIIVYCLRFSGFLNIIACLLHIVAQIPHPRHNSELIRAFLSDVIVIASAGHTFMHFSHPVHLSRMTLAMNIQ